MYHQIKYLTLVSLWLMIPILTLGQLSVSKNGPNKNPSHLINNVLLGNGVTVTNVTFQGDTNAQFGFFRDLQTSIIGLDSGIVLCTGDINELVPGGTPPFVLPTPNIKNNDLLTIANSVPGLLNITPPFTVDSVNNVALIDFEFVPESDTVEFRFVFGSEEYPDYTTTPPSGGFINRPFNDVFGFFISGPGITGPYSSPPKFTGGSQNVAFIPGTNPQIPITVSSVHNGGPTPGGTVPPLNSSFFVPGDVNNVNLNGFTVPLTARLAVQACDTFNIRLAIGDGDDRSLTSAVFLEARSFSSPNVKVSAVPLLYNLNADGNLYENCGSVSLAFRRFNDIANQRIVKFKISGTAQNGIDYSFVPDSVIFQPGDQFAGISFNIFNDGIIEGMETMVIGIQPDTIGCVIQDSTSTTLEILDPVAIQVVSDSINADCLADTLFISKPILQGVEPFNFVWSTGDTVDTLVFTPPSDSTFFVTITDACGIDTAFSSVKVTNFTPPLSISTKNDTILCTDTAIQIGVNVLSGSQQQNFQWSNGKTSQNIFVAPANDSIFYVSVSDICFPTFFMVDSVEVFRAVPNFSLTSKNDTLDCLENSGKISVNVLNGSATQKYLWSTGDTTSSITIPKIGKDTTYLVTVTDVCDSLNPKVDTVSAFDFNPPLIISSSDTTLNCNSNPVSISPIIISGSSKQSYLWSTGDTTSFIDVNPINSTFFVVTVTDACLGGNPQVDTINVSVITPPLIINAQDLNAVCDTNATVVSVNVTSGSAPLTFLWSNGEVSPSFNAKILSDTNFIVTVSDGCGNMLIDTATIDFQTPSPILVSFQDTSITCPGDSIALKANITGGVPPYNIIWNTGNSGDSITVSPLTTTQYVLQVTDQCVFGYVLDTVNVTVPTYPKLMVSVNDTSIDCLGDSAIVSAVVSGGRSPYNLFWEGPKNQLDTATNLFLIRNLLDQDNYYATAQDLCGTIAMDTGLITLTPKPNLNVDLGIDTIICSGDQISIIAKVGGGVPKYSFEWAIDEIPTNDTTQTLAQQFEESANVSVVVTDVCLNKADAQKLIQVKSCEVDVPNIFSPNGDGNNDFFIIPGLNTIANSNSELPSASIVIFNRWGMELYSSDFYQNNWDAHGVVDGTYFYILTLSTGEVIKGNITITH